MQRPTVTARRPEPSTPSPACRPRTRKLQKERAPRPPTKQPFSLPCPFLVRSAFSRSSLPIAFAYEFRLASIRTQKDLHRCEFTSSTALSGKTKTVAVAAFLGDSRLYRQKAADCCGNVTIDFDAAILRFIEASHRLWLSRPAYNSRL